MNVRRLAAIDMFGLYGTARRRHIIVAEFLVGVFALLALGSWLLATAHGWGAVLFGLWALGVGLNYVPLSVHSLTLTRPGALAAELAGVQPRAELSRYGLLQFWIAVPLALVGFQCRDLLARSTPRRRP